MFEEYRDVFNVLMIALALGKHVDPQLYLVGGAVRDIILGHKVKDLDFATDLYPTEVLGLLEKFAAIPNSQIKSVFDIRKDLGTIGCHVVVGNHDVMVDITTFRSDVYDGDRTNPHITFGDNIRDDLARRDFTINAMAYNVISGEFVDPYGGREHLKEKRLEAVEFAVDRFVEDPLRILRGVRFMARLGLEMSDEICNAAFECRSLVNILSAERIYGELMSMLRLEHAAMAFVCMRDLGILEEILPELIETIGVEQPPTHHRFDVFHHTMAALAAACQMPFTSQELRLAILLHDIGKPVSRQMKDGRIVFYGHEEESAKMAKLILGRLKAPTRTIETVCHIIRCHMRPHLVDFGNMRKVRRFLHRTDLYSGDELIVASETVCLHAMFDKIGGGKKPVKVVTENFQLQMMVVAKARSFLPELPRNICPLSGDEIMEHLRIDAGPTVGKAKRFLTELVLDEILAIGDKEQAYVLLRDWYRDVREAS